MVRIVVSVIVVFNFVVGFALAQTDTPDYRIQIVGQPEVDDMFVSITYAVYNQGGAADRTATVELVNLADSEQIIVTDEIRALQGDGDLVEQTLQFPITTFPPNAEISVYLTVGLNEIEPDDGPTSGNNISRAALITIPDYDPAQLAAEEPLQEEKVDDPAIITLPLLDVEIDTNDPQQVTLLIGIVVSGAVMVIMALLIIRLLFQRSPSFGNWQPPYATMPPLDPNSTFGRRQSWQQHAQNNIIPTPCQSGSVHPRKVLVGMDSHYLSGWQIVALRMTQYDMYGRVSRSQILAPNRMVKRLDRVARKADTLDPETLARRVRPVAKALAKRFRKRINARSAMLPIALDVRLQGHHGEVRIVFELYDCVNGQPRKLDYWEPEMTVLGKTIHESYTFTIFGQRGGETYKDFRKRLGEDIDHTLRSLFQNIVSTPERRSQPQAPITNPVDRVRDEASTPPPPPVASENGGDKTDTQESKSVETT